MRFLNSCKTFSSLVGDLQITHLAPAVGQLLSFLLYMASSKLNSGHKILSYSHKISVTLHMSPVLDNIFLSRSTLSAYYIIVTCQAQNRQRLCSDPCDLGPSLRHFSKFHRRRIFSAPSPRHEDRWLPVAFVCVGERGTSTCEFSIW